MKSNKLNMRVLASVLVVAFILPFIFTGNYSDAATVKESLKANMQTYGFDADLDNMTIKTKKALNTYVNAGDANNRRNKVSEYPAGTYYVYKSVNGSINLSKNKGVAGAWVNTRDIESEQVVVKKSIAFSSSNKTVKLASATKVYSNAEDATNERNSRVTYSAGNYYVYKEFGNLINITKNAGKAGGWVKKSAVTTATTVKAPVNNKVSNNNSSQEKVVLKSAQNVYSNAEDALKGVNSKIRYSQGTYFVYKTYGKAINISDKAGKAGGWILREKLDASKPTVVVKPAPAPKPVAKPAPKPVAKPAPKPKPVVSTPAKVKNTATMTNDGKIQLSNRTSIYVTAANALTDRNAVGTWGPGTYHIYKTYGKAVNISTSPSSPGAWIDGSKIGGSVAAPAPKPVAKPAPKPAPKPAVSTPVVKDTTVTKTASGKFYLPQDMPIYVNADNAVSGTNPVGTFRKGEYFIYKTYGNAVNITRVEGEAGGWISAKLEEASKVTERPKVTEKAPVVAEVKPVTSAPRTEDKSASTDSTGKEFVLVLDPGHGGGAAHNRGGLLFNEGDQNFIFTQKILEQAKKYKNIRTSSTRTSNNEDPAYADRANAGDGADLYVSIHTNASVPQAKGVEVWGGNDNTKTGQNLSKDITATWAKELNTTDRGVKYAQAGNRPNTTKPVKGARDPWFVFKDNEAKDKLILESVFHTNYQDSKAFLEKQDKLAENFMSIVARHYGLILK